LPDGDVHAGGLGVVHALEVDQEAVGIDHGHRDVPAVLLALGDDFRCDLLRSRGINGRSIFGTPVLGRCGGGTGNERRAEQDTSHFRFPLLHMKCTAMLAALPVVVNSATRDASGTAGR
jgi:hypothetical protein